MGFAVARAAHVAGHDVTLVAGPVVLRTPRGVKRVDVESARDMLAAVRAALSEGKGAVVLVMAAAVADWRPAECATQKLKKSQMSGLLRLVRNPDILKSLGPRAKDDLRIGFAAETGEPTAEAARKCREKGLDFVVANDVTQPGAGFGTRTNRVTFVFPDGRAERLPLMTKDAVARRIVRMAERMVEIGA
jgi:phosphopantothenoylcysteine decarboxylase/phosphopantothenate--cysteine ligase